VFAVDEEIIIYHDETEDSEEKKVKHKPRKPKKDSKRGIITFLILLLLAALFIGFKYKGFIFSKSGEATNLPTVAATVNGQLIMMSELNTRFEKVPENLQPLFTTEFVLRQLIDQELLLQEASSLGITSNESIVDKIIKSMKQQYQSEEIFNEILEKQNTTLEELRFQVTNQVIISELLDSALFSELKVTNTEIENYYKENFDNTTSMQEVQEEIIKGYKTRQAHA